MIIIRTPAEHNITQDKTETLIELLMTSGQMLLENGAETFRVETAVLNMFDALSARGEINVVALGTLLTISISDGEHRTAIRRIRRRGMNLEKLSRVNDVVRKVSEGKMSAEDSIALIKALDLSKTGHKLTQIFSAAVFVSGIFAFMVGGSALDACLAFVCCIIVQSGWFTVRKSSSLIFVFNIFSGFLVAMIAGGVTSAWECSAEQIIFAALLPLFPGVAMIIAIRDTICGDLTSGVARGVEAVLTASGLAVGASLGLMCASYAWGFVFESSTETMFGLAYAALGLLVSFGTGLMLNAKIEVALWGALIGGLVYAVFLLCGGAVIGMFAAAIALTTLSEAAARVLKTPSTLFLIMGIYPLVPGAGIYKTAVLILQNNSEQALAAGNTTIAEFLFIAAGIAIVSALFRGNSYKN